MIIDEQFRTLIPPLTADEYARLEENILKEGIRDKLVVWGETLIDGHNRFRIATENDLPYETVEMPFESREHALNWIISNQLGRRNLNPNQIAYLRGRRYEAEKKISTDTLKKGDSLPCTQNENTGRTSQTLADEYGVGKSTILRNANFAKVVDILPEDVRQEVLSGEEKISCTMTDTIMDFDPPAQKKFLQEVESGTPIKEAVKKVDPEQKRRDKEAEVREAMEREQGMRDRLKFSPNNRKFNDIVSGTKGQVMENEHFIPDDAEIWVIYKKDAAEEARLILNTHTSLKIN